MLLRVVTALLTASFIAACTATEVEGTRDGAVGPLASAQVSTIVPGEAIVVMDTGNANDDLGVCVRSSMESGDAEYRVLGEKTFRDMLFPWFEEESVSADVIATLLERSLVRKRIKDLGVRYVIVVTGGTTSDRGGSEGGILCGSGYTGGGCFGLMWWERMSNLSAAVWDLSTGSKTGNVAVNVTGTNVMPAIVIPVPLIAPTESAACEELGERLTRFITTGELPEKPAEQNTKENSGTTKKP